MIYSDANLRSLGMKFGFHPRVLKSIMRKEPTRFISVSFSERRLSLLRVEVYEVLATATGEIRVWLRL